ncbi:uncharacterized protein [Nicotiana tomentosiformis]|uniref:uncharacterized protein n=1 Tax=Nicotiana tomentosiformis TaxID=4098 RepID=UPI00388CC294
MVANALSRKAETLCSLAFIPAEERPLVMVVQALANRFVRLDISKLSRVLACVIEQSSLLERIKYLQFGDPHLLVLEDLVQRGGARKMFIGDYRIIQLQGRICVPNVNGLRDLILELIARAILVVEDEEGHCWTVDEVRISETGWFNSEISYTKVEMEEHYYGLYGRIP